MPELLLETLDRGSRETSHRHIEECSVCSEEWRATRATWRELGELPELPVPASVRAHFDQHLAGHGVAPSNVLQFRRRFPVWAAQAAAVVLMAGGAFVAGQQFSPASTEPTSAEATSATVAKMVPQQYPIAQSVILPASQVNPLIEGRPAIENIRFFRENDSQVGLEFDMTSKVTVTGKPDDKSIVSLLSYVLEDKGHPAQSKSSAIQWVKETYGSYGATDPRLTKALANVLKSEEHEGMRINAADALRSLPPSGGAGSGTELALIEALKNDPNPAVRIKAVDALTKLSQGGQIISPAAVDTLRQKASQDDENLYVRVKAAEALGQINL